MDIDSLSLDAFCAVIIPADKFHESLSADFEILADCCNTEEGFLENAQELAEYWSQCDELDSAWANIFWDDEEVKSKEELVKTLKTIAENIKKVRKIPEEKREYDF
ncbi:MAG: hypothetical protein LBQ31_03460 [Bacteroidales bacterium]|jgi:hypothetical protein|nr:hypothetical protein [Bacteroidales bacterium]